MICSHCGENNGDEAVFCKSCGLKIVHAEKLPPVALGNQQKQSIFSQIGGLAGGLIGIVIIYAVVNGVLWFGQEAYHHEDNVKLEQMESRINELKTKIENYESTAERYGMTDATYTNYESAITEHNKLIEEYNSLAEDSGTRWYVIPVPTGHSGATH